MASSDKDHLKKVMDKIKAQKGNERRDLDRVLATRDGGIEGIGQYRNGGGRGATGRRSRK